MTKKNRTENQLQLDGTAKVSGLDVFHKALSPEVIHLDRGQLTYQMNIGKQTAGTGQYDDGIIQPNKISSLSAGRKE